MAVIRRQPGAVMGQTPTGVSAPAPAAVAVAPTALSLPTAKSTPPTSIDQYRILIYGEAGIGKTSLVARFRKTLFFAWEVASRGVSIYKTDPLSSWQIAKAYIEMLGTQKHDFQGACWDTVAPAYDRCLEHVCAAKNVPHPGQTNDFGATWKAVNDEFRAVQDSIEAAGLVLTALAHERISEYETRTGGKLWRVEPNIGGKCLEYYRSSTDIIGYYFAMGGQRWLQIVGDDFVMAKANPEGHFRTPSGERIHRIPMGTSADEAYAYFVNAFDNKQKETYERITSSALPPSQEITEERATARKLKHSKPKSR